jgi:hypothetical protein
MRFPNAFRGVKKIWLAELLMLLAVVVGIVLLVVVAANSTMEGEQVVVNQEAVKTPVAILGISAALIALIGFILNLVGLINARKDEEAFKVALLVTGLGIIAAAIGAIWSSNAVLNKWMDTLTTIFSMFASYFVLTGIANLADRMPDPETKAVALKSRLLVEGSFCATAVFKLIINIFNIQSGSTIHTIMAVVAMLLELLAYILYLRALAKGRKMLAK